MIDKQNFLGLPDLSLNVISVGFAVSTYVYKANSRP